MKVVIAYIVFALITALAVVGAITIVSTLTELKG
jgi:hypothetical protein